MRAHVIENGVITNTIVVDSVEDWPDMQLVNADHGGSIGDMYMGLDDAGIPLFSSPLAEG